MYGTLLYDYIETRAVGAGMAIGRDAMLHVLRQVLFGAGVFVGIIIKFAGVVVAGPAVLSLLLHGAEAIGIKGAIKPFLTLPEAVGFFAAGLAIAACGMGLLLYSFYRLGENGMRTVMAIIFGGAIIFFAYVQLSTSLTVEGRVILGVFMLACVMILLVVAAPTQQPRQTLQPPPPARPLTRAEKREQFWASRIKQDNKPGGDRPTYH